MAVQVAALAGTVITKGTAAMSAAKAGSSFSQGMMKLSSGGKPLKSAQPNAQQGKSFSQSKQSPQELSNQAFNHEETPSAMDVAKLAFSFAKKALEAVSNPASLLKK